MLLDERQYPDYNPSQQEQDKCGFMEKRFKAMQQERSKVDVKRKDYQTMLDAVLKPYWDERSSSNVPLLSAAVEMYVADATKIATEYTFRADVPEFATQAKAREAVWKYDWRKNKRKIPITKSEYVAATFGDAVLYAGTETTSYTQEDPIVSDSGTIKWEKKTVQEDNIILSNVDINKFWLDNETIDWIDDANDCFFRQWIGFEKFQNFKTNPLYKNIQFIKPRGYDNSYGTAVSQEDQTRQGEYVLLEHYWNLELDRYMVKANGILVRDHPILSTIRGKKALPFVMRGFGYKINSIYHRGLWEALMMFNGEINNLREMCSDAVRRSNTNVIAIGNWLRFSGRDFSYENEIITFDWNLAENFQQISGNPPNAAIFDYMDRIYKDIAIFVGIDIQNLLWEPQQTAFQTEVQREASQKRINVWLTNRDLAFERLADLHWENLWRFFPKKNTEGKYPIVPVDGKDFKNGRFITKKWTGTFSATPELLREWDVFIDVFTNTTAPTINAVDREQKTKFLTDVGTIVQSYSLAKQAGMDIEGILPAKQTIRDLAQDYNITIEANASDEEVKEAKQELMQWLRGMLPTQLQEPQVDPSTGQPLAPSPQQWSITAPTETTKPKMQQLAPAI